MAEEFGERTQAATPKRKREAVRQGDTLKSRDFATALVVLAGVAWVVMFGPQLIRACEAVMAASFQFGRSDIDDFSPFRPLAEAGWKLAPSLVTLFVIGILAAIASQAALGSFGFNPGLLTPKASRVNPASGLKRIFGTAGWIELGKSLLKIVLLGCIGGWALWRSTRSTIGMASSDVGTAVHQLGGTFVGILMAMAFGLVVIAGIDVPIQAWRLYAKLRMSRQAIKDEHKESEGSPENKQRLRSQQRAVLKRSVKKAVAEADVILTNPTHFAVALRYDRGRDQVPVVVAKGRGATALAIRELAAEAQIPSLEYPMLARAVYYTSREGQEVRDDLYVAIATVLAFVFNLNAAAGGSTMPPPVAVPPGARFDENGIALA
ncbi:flagellar type III secretion system protein FlhB [Sphingomonas bacterium]|uniref:flagellar type III secretion system protein FlhB n=1 Tax=Sphingomonas bacterium TaxID=1895847 RepID=UPI001576C439|nr:flagellar type III secretion system protein FlhB [Sphingomonas bacterium]